MDDSKLEEAMKATIGSMGKAISKPPMAKKLLKKPPFRFLFDVVMEVIKTSGFLDGLYTAEEIDPASFKENKAAKIAFLQKAIDATAFASNKSIPARPSKIVSGADPELTNIWLQAMGKCVLKKVDSTQAVQRVLAGEKPPSKPSSSKAPQKSAESKSEVKPESKSSSKPSSAKPSSAKPSSAKEGKSKDGAKREPSADKKDGDRRERSGSSKRESSGKPSGGSKSKPGSGVAKSDKSESSTKERKSKSSAKEKTRDKSKDGEKDKDRDRDRDKHRDGDRDKHRDKDRDGDRDRDRDKHRDGDRDRDKGRDGDREKSARSKSSKDGKAARPSKASGERKRPSLQDEAQVDHSTDHATDDLVPVDKDGGDGIVGTSDASPTDSDGAAQRPHNKIAGRRDQSDQGPEKTQRKRQERPSSARRSRPDMDPNQFPQHHQQLPHEEQDALAPSDDRDTLEEAASDEIDQRRQQQQQQQQQLQHDQATQRVEKERPKTSRRVKKPMDDAPLETSKVVKDVEIIKDDDGNEDDEEDTFVVVEAKKDPTPVPIDRDAEQNNEEKGFLMRKIEGKKEEADPSLKENANKSALAQTQAVREAQRRKEREVVSTEVEKLREGIQTLCRTANPLGKIVDYVQEDVDAMQSEMTQWQEELAANNNKIADDAVETDKHLQPLRVKLAELDQQILDQEAMIRAMKANTLDNDERIQKLLRGIAYAARA